MSKYKIRFTPYSNEEFGFISFNPAGTTNTLSALVINESAQGCCLAINKRLLQPPEILEVGMNIVVKVGNLEPVDSIVRWFKSNDDDIVKIGVEYKFE